MKIKKLSLCCILLIGFIILQSGSVPSLESENLAVSERLEPKSSGTFTIENFSDRDLNISLYNLENNGTYSFADVPLGTTPDFFTGTDSTIETTVIQNCSVGYNQNLFRFRANPGMGQYITVATLPNQKFPINRIEFLFRWDGSTGRTLGLSLSNTGLFYFNHVQFAFQNDNWINHGLTLTNWNKISLIYTGGTWQLWLNDILKYTRAYTINNRTELTLKLHVASGAVSDYLYIDTIDIGSESTKQNFIDQKISADQIPTTNYWNDRIPAYSNILVHKDSDKYISTTQNDYYIVNRDLLSHELYEVKNGSSYQFYPDLFHLKNNGENVLNVSLYEQNEYQGHYSFQNLPEGSSPWVDIDGTSSVLHNTFGRRTILNVSSSGGIASVVTKFDFEAASPSFEVEFWTYLTSDKGLSFINIGNSSSLKSSIFFVFNNDMINIYSNQSGGVGISIPLEINNWAHFLISLNCQTQLYTVLMNNQIVAQDYHMYFNLESVDSFWVKNVNEKSIYFDSVDFSTAPKYEFGRSRNLIHTDEIDCEFWQNNYIPDHSAIVHSESEKKLIVKKQEYYVITREITTNFVYDVSNSNDRYVYEPNTLILGIDIVWIDNVPYFCQSAKISAGLKEIKFKLLNKIRTKFVYFNETGNILEFSKSILKLSNTESTPVHCELYKNNHYTGALSFEEFENGTLPAYITLANPDSNAYVLDSFLGHNKVLELSTKNYGGGIKLNAEFEDEGSIEFWLFSKKNSYLSFSSTDHLGNYLGFAIYIYSDVVMTPQKQITNALTVNNWNHFTLVYNKSLGFYNLSINLNPILINESLYNPNQNPNRIANFNFNLMYEDICYIDSFDTSAYSNYYLYRSLEMSKNTSLYELIEKIPIGSYSTVEIFNEDIFYYKIFDWNRNLIDEGLFNASHLSYISKIRPKMVYFSIFDISGLGLDASTVRFYINGTRTEFRRHDILASHVHLLVLDYFNATLFNSTISIEEINEFNIYVPVFTLSLFNNYSEPVIVVIERDGLGFTNLEQQISPQTGLEHRFLANVEYTISILHVNGTELETRTVNLTENKQLSFGFYSAEISKEDLKTTLNDLLFLISIVLGLGAVFLVSFIYSYAKLTNRDARIVKKVKKAGKTGRDDRDFLGGY